LVGCLEVQRQFVPCESKKRNRMKGLK
jgi:hypothetical protein